MQSTVHVSRGMQREMMFVKILRNPSYNFRSRKSTEHKRIIEWTTWVDKIVKVLGSFFNGGMLIIMFMLTSKQW